MNFKTIKYCGELPSSFNSGAGDWCEGFITYCNHNHRHCGIGLHAPASVRFGTAGPVREQCAVILAEACARHPGRLACRPAPPAIPDQVWINEPKPETEPAIQSS